MPANSTYPLPDWAYCRCPKRQRIENAMRPGTCYRCNHDLPNEADADIAAGRVASFETVEAFLADLDDDE